MDFNNQNKITFNSFHKLPQCRHLAGFSFMDVCKRYSGDPDEINNISGNILLCQLIGVSQSNTLYSIFTFVAVEP